MGVHLGMVFHTQMSSSITYHVGLMQSQVKGAQNESKVTKDYLVKVKSTVVCCLCLVL